LEAVHGAQAQVYSSGITVDRRLDLSALRTDPMGRKDQLLLEVRAVQALHQSILSHGPYEAEEP
ncbi:MAG: hypothetical protein ACI9VR_003867, partial [Cognaticolwellia sp.]